MTMERRNGNCLEGQRCRGATTSTSSMESISIRRRRKNEQLRVLFLCCCWILLITLSRSSSFCAQAFEQGIQPSVSLSASLSVRPKSSALYFSLLAEQNQEQQIRSRAQLLLIRPRNDGRVSLSNKQQNQPHTALFLSDTPVNNNKKASGNDDGNGQRRPPFLVRVVQRYLFSPFRSILFFPSTVWARLKVTSTRFQALPSRAKKIVVAYILILMLAFGGLTGQVVTKARMEGRLGPASYSGPGSPRRPIEIAYSSFLDLVELSNPTKLDSDTAPVRLDQVRIGSERVLYKLYYNAHQVDTLSDSSLVPTSSSAAAKSKSKQKTAKAVTVTPLSPTLVSTAAKSSKKGAAAKGAVEEQTLASFLASQQQQPTPKQQKQQTAAVAAETTTTSEQPFVVAFTRHLPATGAAGASASMISLLRDNRIRFTAAVPPKRTVATIIANTVRTFIVTLYALFLWRLYRNMTGGGGGGGPFGGGGKDMPGKLAGKKGSRTAVAAAGTDEAAAQASFDDIQGIDNAKLEVMELVDTLKYPDKYSLLGARAPTGLLLEGPPGTGKTLLARATAAAAGVPLLYCSGSDFVEVFVGRGAARIRNLFERAQKIAPCIIFIDELDALGKARDGVFGGAGPPGGFGGRNDEAEQTINQLLACMDGLDSSRQVIVLAATNRRDVLDPALVRPGRFDRIVKLKLPDAAGRESILRVHCNKLPGFVEGSGIDLDRPGSLGRGRRLDLTAIAAVTEGFSGAELEFIVNEAAIRAVRRVSAALRQHGTKSGVATPEGLTPHVQAQDFEESLKNFYETRRPKSPINDLLRNMWNKP